MAIPSCLPIAAAGRADANYQVLTAACMPAEILGRYMPRTPLPYRASIVFTVHD